MYIKTIIKTLITNVMLTFLGTGKIEINGQDINFFDHIAPKETVSAVFSFNFMLNCD